MAKQRRAGAAASARRKRASKSPRGTRIAWRQKSPMKFTDNLLADARHRYETTLESLTTIALDLGVCRATLRSFALKRGWVRYDAPPLDISPAARLAQRTAAFVRTVGAIPLLPDSSDDGAAPHGTSHSDMSHGDMSHGDIRLGSVTDAMPSDAAAVADWLRREVQAQIGIVKKLREKERAEPLTEERAVLLGRMLVQLTDTFIKLNRFNVGAEPVPAEPDDLPEDIDEFRFELARRIDAFVASRTDTADGGATGAATAMAAV